MAEVFISYSSMDSVKAKDIVDRIEGAGISCWISQRDIPPGADYAIEIPKAISMCSYFVLLLTNAAQESPYVMLELDQAFKQKKEIIPILLEQIVENEKTNFFLNAKQKLDGTSNLTTAVNDTIHRIKPDVTVQLDKQSAHNSTNIRYTETIKCPFCGCLVVKQKRFFLNRYLYPQDGQAKNDTISTWLVKNRVNIELAIQIYSTIAILALLIILLSSSDRALIEIITLIIILAAHSILLYLSSTAANIPDIIGQFIRVIRNSKLKYWSFRCAGCEKDFSLLIPQEADLKKIAPKMIEDTAE